MTKRKNRRQDLLIAARDLIFSQGIGNLTTKALAKRVGVSEPAIYRHFSDKADLISHVLTLLFVPWRKGLRNIVRRSEPAPYLLRRVAHFHLNMMVKAKLNPLMFFGEAVSPGQEDLREFLFKELKFLRKCFHTLVLRGQKEGTLRPEVPAQLMVATLVGLLQAGVIRGTLKGSWAKPVQRVCKCFRGTIRHLFELTPTQGKLP